MARQGIHKGGQAIHGQDIGILMLDTRFPRIPGDVGNAASFDFPVRYRVVQAATVDQIVATAETSRQHLPAFIEAAQELEQEGARALVTTCGFLTVFQEELAAAVSIPVVTSSLLLVPLIRQMLGPQQAIGILTADDGNLSSAHLTAAGIQPDWPIHIRGLQDCPAFASAILRPDPAAGYPLDAEAIEQELVQVSKGLLEEHPEIGALVFECTNLPPYVESVKAAVKCPIFSILDVVELLHRSL